jgi:regulator with DNA binding domain protein
MVIFIKGMVCQRCIMIVGQLLERIGIEAVKVDLGRIDLYDVPTSEQMQALDRGLKELGFELVFDKRPQLIEAIKLATIDYVYANPPSRQNFSDYIIDHLHYDYHYISDIFSSTEGIPLGKYAIKVRMRRARQLLRTTHDSVADIAYALGYTSQTYMSTQFKKETGLSPLQYRKQSQE